MSARRALLILCVVAAVAGAVWVGRGAVARFASPAAEVPTFTISEAPFRRTVTADGALKAVKSTTLTAPSLGHGAFFILWLAEDGAQVKKGDVVIRFDSAEATRGLADGKDDQAAALQRIARERQQIEDSLAERSRSARLTKEEMAKAKELGKKDPRYFPRNEVIESEIDESLYATRLSKTEAARAVEERLAGTRIELLAVDKRKAEISTLQARDALRSLEVRAPHDGTFLIMRSNNILIQPGDRARPGMRVAEVAQSDRMDAEVFVLEADAGGLAKGKDAEVVLEARPDDVWRAKVKQVDPFPKPRRWDVPAQYFATILELDGKSAGLKPGQSLHATIALEEVPRALVVPRQAVFTRGDETFVYRRAPGGGFERAPVVIGAGTVGRLLIEKGLSPGDQVALRDPFRSADDTVGGGAGGGGGGGKKTGKGKSKGGGAAALVDPNAGVPR